MGETISQSNFAFSYVKAFFVNSSSNKSKFTEFFSGCFWYIILDILPCTNYYLFHLFQFVKIVNCPPLSLENGEVMYNTTQVSNDRLIVGTRASFTCEYGYSLSGSSSSTCNSAGNWNESTQTCNQSN